ncbi:hypothetical protein OH77DRAFT_1399844 [Trametes cingulata]|nr:hypothetical protein OH77DRAFT_1399844 [Trametes cingulata]
MSIPPGTHLLETRASPTNGSCISGPDESCVSLVGLCVSKISIGQVGSTAFWTDSVCVAAATCAGMGAVLNAACCAGTCRKPTDIASLDTNVYKSMIGSCSTQPTGCSLTWQPFVDWFYNTIQTTGTNLWPFSGDDVLDRWAAIANWTGFCQGNNCVNGAIPYHNFNDWFHFSSAVIVTTPGTPQYVRPLSTNRTENDGIDEPDFSWPCPFDDPDDCWWDYGPDALDNIQSVLVAASRVASSTTSIPNAAPLTAKIIDSDPRSPFPFGRAPRQPPNVPPPVYVNGQLLQLHLDGDSYNTSGAPPSIAQRSTHEVVSRLAFPLLSDDSAAISLVPTPTVSSKRARITPDTCTGGATNVDIPLVLPVLTYYCDLLPNICENIRAHDDWDPTTDTMILHYDPFDKGGRRTDVCSTEEVARLRDEGSCDPRQHDPTFWKISCDEFPFTSTLEGGAGNARIMGVPTREQDYQGNIQSAITHLREVQNKADTTWHGNSNKKCHRYMLKLAGAPPAGSVVNTIGRLDAGTAFFAKPADNVAGFKWLTDRRVSRGIPAPYPVDTDYDPTETAMFVPRFPTKIYNCAPCSDSDSDSDSGSGSDSDSVLAPLNRSVPAVHGNAQSDDSKPTATSAPTPSVLKARQAQSSCTRPSGTPLPATPSQAAAIAAANIASANAAAAAASAALASVSNPDPAQAAAAAVAVSAASALGPAAAALSIAGTDAAAAAAIAVSESAVETTQDAVSSIFSLGLDLFPDWLSNVVHHSISASSSIASTIQSSDNVIDPQTPIPPNTDPSKNPLINSGPPPNAPAAACFGAGSQGFVRVGSSCFTFENVCVLSQLQDVGSDAYFGLTIRNNWALVPYAGCKGVYRWDDAPLAPDFQVDCSTMELGSYWNGQKQTCYTYPTSDFTFTTVCGNNIANIYTCLQQNGVYQTLRPAFINWQPQ